MKPRKAMLTAAAVTALFSAGGCVYNDVPCVYGPPPDATTTPFVAQYETGETSDADGAGSFRPEDNVMQAMYGVPDYRDTAPFDPEENMEQPEYGAPVIESMETAETSETDETTDTAEPTVSEEQPVALPEDDGEPPVPDDFEPSDNIAQAVYGPPPIEEPLPPDPPDFDAEENMNPDVYGPPPFEADPYDDVQEETAEFDPSENVEECVYGPPEWFE